MKQKTSVSKLTEVLEYCNNTITYERRVSRPKHF